MDNQQPSVNNSFFHKKPKKGYGFIYMYTSPSGKKYIGQTVNSLSERAKNIISGIGYKKCTVFWKAIQKYGWNKFLCSILEEILIEDLNSREQYWIKYFNSFVPNGYNLTIGGETGKTHSVYVYSAQNGQLLEHYNSITEASRSTGVPIETISTILSNKNNRRQAHNLTFSNNYYEKYDLSKLARSNYRATFVYDEKGTFLNSFETVMEASRQLGIGEAGIRKCLEGKASHVYNYQFKKQFFEKIPPIPKNSKSPVSVAQIDLKTKKIIKIYPSYAAAARGVGLSSGSGIKKVALSGKGSSGGFFWILNEGSTTKRSENPSETVRGTFKKGEDIV